MSVLQCVASCCKYDKLQHIRFITRYNTLQHTATQKNLTAACLCCSVLQRVVNIIHCNTLYLQHTATHCNTNKCD